MTLESELEIREIDKDTMQVFVNSWHYSHVMPRLTKHRLGFYHAETLIGCVSLGWGVRPVNTIARLFPSCVSKDYLEIGKFCCRDEEPKNTESYLLSQTIGWLKSHRPDVKVLFTWADGFRGKPGYIYQAANFLYGGEIWTDRYIDKDGGFVHPLGSKKRARADKSTGDLRTRPSVKEQTEQGISHYWGKQFRYVYFLCSRKEKRRLLAETTVSWGTNYPKHTSLQWKIAAQGSKVTCERPTFKSEVRFLGAAPFLAEAVL